jgi:hypothetical protein
MIGAGDEEGGRRHMRVDHESESVISDRTEKPSESQGIANAASSRCEWPKKSRIGCNCVLSALLLFRRLHAFIKDMLYSLTFSALFISLSNIVVMHGV